MKKYIFLTITLILFLTTLIIALSVKQPEVNALAVENIVINEEYVVMRVGESSVILASVYPFNANNQTIIWSSEDAGIASVENGVVVGNSVGNTRIYATTEEGGFQDYCYVDVIY